VVPSQPDASKAWWRRAELVVWDPLGRPNAQNQSPATASLLRSNLEAQSSDSVTCNQCYLEHALTHPFLRSWPPYHIPARPPEPAPYCDWTRLVLNATFWRRGFIEGVPRFGPKRPIHKHYDEHWSCRLSSPPTTGPSRPWLWQPASWTFLPSFIPNPAIFATSVLRSTAASSTSTHLPAVSATKFLLWKLPTSVERILSAFDVI
jgi:hypothetical protein